MKGRDNLGPLTVPGRRRINLKFNEIVQKDKIRVKLVKAIIGPVDRKEN